MALRRSAIQRGDVGRIALVVPGSWAGAWLSASKVPALPYGC